jgi:hypothetical protein
MKTSDKISRMVLYHSHSPHLGSAHIVEVAKQHTGLCFLDGRRRPLRILLLLYFVCLLWQ